MQSYPIPMVPGPVKVPEEILAVYRTNFGSGDLENEYFELYDKTEANLQTILNTSNQVVIQTGEGMIALWSALKSSLFPGDRVLSLSSGYFGTGIGKMAQSIGADVTIHEIPFNETFSNWEDIERIIDKVKPKMITVVHCETPSGTLNPISEIGKIKDRHQVPLLYVDAVASVGASPVLTDEWNIDLVLGGSQKVLSAPPNMAFVSVSQRAWEIIDEVDYNGYDALKSFRNAQKDKLFPYTPYWHGMAVLNAAAERLLAEGLENSYSRHIQVASYCRKHLQEIGLDLFYAPVAVPSPTVTAVKVPGNFTFSEMDIQFRKHGLVVGGSYGEMEGHIFRIGHMGTQADMTLLAKALDVIRKVIK